MTLDLRRKCKKSSGFDYSDAYICVKGRITITGAGDNAAERQGNERNKGVIFKIVPHSLLIKVK